MKGASFGNVNPGQFTPESLARYQVTGDYSDLVPFRSPVQIDQGDRKTLYDPGSKQERTYGVGMKPSEAISAGQRQRELEYNTPSPKQTQKFGVTDPSGVTHYFPSQQAADGFKRAIGGR